jgi:diguanylate cyclase (GGDEF)-like protein
MDLTTSFAFYLVSLALYLVVLTSMALADRRVAGTRWLAYSVVLEMIKVGLQVSTGSVPRLLSTMVASELNMAAFFAMYMGIRWFILREPLRRRTGPAVLIGIMVVYAGMFFFHLPYGFQVMAAVVIWICGASVGILTRQREERFLLPSRLMASLLTVQMALVLYRMVLSARHTHQGVISTSFAADPRWTNSMMFIIMLANCLLIMYVWFAAAEMYSAVQVTAGTDVLTGCLNRRALMKIAAQEFARSERTGMPLTIAAVDLDHFKRVNDSFGHAGGDAMLCGIVAQLRGRLRSVDVVARTGGEEFLVLLPDTDAISGAQVMEMLRLGVEQLQVKYDGLVITATISIGVTQALPGIDTWTAMVSRADRALYAAKEAGRNRIVIDEQAANLPRRAVGIRQEALRTTTAMRLIRKRLG